MFMNEMFHKSQASTETAFERMQRGIVAMADRVLAFETQLPIAKTDPNATAADTHVDDDPFTEDSLCPLGCQRPGHVRVEGRTCLTNLTRTQSGKQTSPISGLRC